MGMLFTIISNIKSLVLEPNPMVVINPLPEALNPAYGPGPVVIPSVQPPKICQPSIIQPSTPCCPTPGKELMLSLNCFTRYANDVFCINFSLNCPVYGSSLWVMYNETGNDSDWNWHTEITADNMAAGTYNVCTGENLFRPNTYYCLMLLLSDKQQLYSSRVYYDGQS